MKILDALSTNEIDPRTCALPLLCSQQRPLLHVFSIYCYVSAATLMLQNTSFI